MGTTTGTQADEVVRLSRPGRLVRTVGLLLAGALFLAGTVVGNDPWWPFGPWRMFATSTSPSGSVVWLGIETRTADTGWAPANLTPESVGLNRAEVEGRMGQMSADPTMLRTLAESHARLKPDDAAWTGVRIVRTARILRDGRPTGEEERKVVVDWEGSPSS